MSMFEQAREWSDILYAILASVQVLVLGALAGMRRFFATPAQVSETVTNAVLAQRVVTERQDKEIADLGARVCEIEGALKRLPTVDDTNRLLLMLEGLRGDTRELSARVDGMGDEQAARLEGMANAISGVSGRVERMYDYHMRSK